MDTLDFGQEYLQLAEAMLRGGGFAVSRVKLSSTLELLVAENDYFVLGIAVAPTLLQLLQMESSLSIDFSNRVAQQAAGPKQWDAYLVLLTPASGEISKDEVAELSAINYNTRYIRRLAHVGVRPTHESLEQALRPFLPLPSLQDLDSGTDALLLLEQELPRYGVDSEHSARVIARYRTSGIIDDA